MNRTTWTQEQMMRIAARVRARRDELGMTQAQAVARAGGGVSEPVWSIIENARQDRYAPRTLAAVTRVLGWSPDSIDRLLRGEEPVQRITVVRGDDGSVRDVIGAKVATVTFEELVAEVSRLRSELHDLAVLTRRLMVEMDADEMSSGDAIPADRASTEDQR